MKYGKFVSKENLVITDIEVDKFVNYFRTIINKYAQESYSVSVTKNNNKSIVIGFKIAEPKSFRNVYGARVKNYKGVSFLLYKEKGYLENWDWYKMEKIDPTKEREDYVSAPEFQYSCNFCIMGTEIPYKCRTESAIVPKHGRIFQFGTELTDLDFNEAVRDICENVSVPMHG